MARPDGGRRETTNKRNGPPGGAGASDAPEAFGRGESDGDAALDPRDERASAPPAGPGANPRRGGTEGDEDDGEPGNGHGGRRDQAQDDRDATDDDRGPARGPARGAAPKKPPFYKRPLVLVLGGLVLLAAVGAGVWYWLYSRQFLSTDDAFIDAHITAISPKVAGLVLEIPPGIDDNRFVNAGQTLLQIDRATSSSRSRRPRPACSPPRASWSRPGLRRRWPRRRPPPPGRTC